MLQSGLSGERGLTKERSWGIECGRPVGEVPHAHAHAGVSLKTPHGSFRSETAIWIQKSVGAPS
jgi:hypothetical protein